MYYLNYEDGQFSPIQFSHIMMSHPDVSFTDDLDNSWAQFSTISQELSLSTVCPDDPDDSTVFAMRFKYGLYSIPYQLAELLLDM